MGECNATVIGSGNAAENATKHESTQMAKPAIAEKGKYDHARSLFLFASTEKSLKEALASFQEIPNYPGADAFISRCEKLLTWNVGSVVEFGTWQGHPLTWEVLESFDKERLLFAHELVGPKSYADVRRITYWEDSDLRRWLNGAFVRENFTLAEQMSIIPTSLINEPNPVVFSQNGGNTVDKVYVFSHQEIVKRGFSEDELHMGDVYWVRNPGITLLASEVVLADGALYHPGVNSEDARIMVRPVMRVRL